MVANVGFSSSKSQQHITPSNLDYNVQITPSESGGLQLLLRMSLEFTNPHPGEAMVIWIKKLKQFLCDQRAVGQELVLVSTHFQDWTEEGRWLDINTDAVVQAVIEDASCGQTAGRVKVAGQVEDAKLGPVGAKGRVVLTYQCSVDLYSYAEMSMGSHGEERVMVPIAIHLPWAPLDKRENSMGVSIDVSTPENATILDPIANAHAYGGLLDPTMNKSLFRDTSVFCVESMGDNSRFQRQWPTLAPSPWCVLAAVAEYARPCRLSVRLSFRRLSVLHCTARARGWRRWTVHRANPSRESHRCAIHAHAGARRTGPEPNARDGDHSCIPHTAI